MNIINKSILFNNMHVCGIIAQKEVVSEVTSASGFSSQCTMSTNIIMRMHYEPIIQIIHSTICKYSKFLV